MAMPFEVYTDHYALQWLKTMRTWSALLHRWSAALEEYDFTVKHRLGKAQTHVDGLSRLPVDPAPPEDVLLHIRLLENEEEARKLAKELHSATHLGGQALWMLFRDRYDYKASRRSVRWVVIMATVRRRREPSSPEGRGTHYQSTLWDLSPPTTARSSSSCLCTATRGIPSSSTLATTLQTR